MLFIPPSPLWLFAFLFFSILVVLLLWVWREAEVMFHTLITPYAVGEQDEGPSRQRGHIVTTGDLNRRLQSFAVTVQQLNRVLLLTGCTETVTLINCMLSVTSMQMSIESSCLLIFLNPTSSPVE